MKSALLERIRCGIAARRAFCRATDLGSGESALIGEGEDPGEMAPELAAAAERALRTDSAAVVSAGGAEHFVEPFNPSPRLVAVGAVHITQALAALAPTLGFEPRVVDPRDSWAAQERFPGTEVLRMWPEEAFAEIGIDSRTAVVMLTHDPKIDDPALLLALASPAPYVGALGSPRTHAKRLERLAEEGVGPEDCARIRAPIGLDIGAANPAEIALAILAEIVSVFRGGPKGKR